MRRAILVTGSPRVNARNGDAVAQLYGLIAKIMREKGYELDVRPPHLPLTISYSCTYLLGHSLGTHTIISDYRRDSHPDVKGIVMFDMSEHDRDIWNGLETYRLAFTSIILGRPWASGIADSLVLKDDHYFTKSHAIIREHLDDFIENAF